MSHLTAEPFDIDVALDRVAAAVAPYPPAAMFDLADRGYRTLFQQLVACIISIRTRDEMMLPLALALFERAPGPADIVAIGGRALSEAISGCAFSARKAEQILAIAATAVRDHGGVLPCDRKLLLSFAGVGPKCANLALGIACNEPFIGVDVHVHRVTNRWGYVAESTPEKTMAALYDKLPRRHWIAINRLLVPFGKHICPGRRPYCSTCPLRPMCAQVGVTASR